MADITLKAMPFDSNEIIDPETGEAAYDRVAYSRDLADWMRTYFSNGVLVRGGNVLGDQLRVVHKEGLTLTVKAGEVCINGRTGWLEADADITVDMGGAQPRIDRVVAELNIPNDRGIYIKVLRGVPAANPTPPELSRTEDNYVLSIAQIRIAAASATIQSVADERADGTACGLSNVTIGIKPPTGNDASTVSASADLCNYYALPFPANIESPLYKAIDLSSYMTFCGNANVSMIDAALGYRNEENVHLIGRQLCMYAKFKGISIGGYPEEYAALLSCDTVADIAGNTLAGALVLRTEVLYNLLSASSLPYFKPQSIVETMYNSIGRIMGLETKSLDYTAFWTNSAVMVRMANRVFTDDWTNKLLSKLFGVDETIPVCDTIFAAVAADTVHFTTSSGSTSYDYDTLTYNDRGMLRGGSANSGSSSFYNCSVASTNGTTQTYRVNYDTPAAQFKHYMYFKTVTITGYRASATTSFTRYVLNAPYHE